MSSTANESDRLPPPFNDLQVIELDPSSQECPYIALQWLPYPDGKLYACIALESERVFLTGESKRGQCTLVKHRDRPTESLSKNVTYLCSFSKERRRPRKARQDLGHAAAAQLVQVAKKTGTAATLPTGTQEITEGDLTAVSIKRVNKNSTGEAVTCAACKYSLQLKVFKTLPHNLYVVLTNGMHTNEHGKVAHGDAGQDVLQKKASPAIRKFVLQQHQAGVPPARILQGVN
jgi:hypothetical protein